MARAPFYIHKEGYYYRNHKHKNVLIDEQFDMELLVSTFSNNENHTGIYWVLSYEMMSSAVMPLGQISKGQYNRDLKKRKKA